MRTTLGSTAVMDLPGVPVLLVGDFDSADFRRHVADLDQLLEHARELEADEFDHTAIIILSQLYADGALLPPVTDEVLSEMFARKAASDPAYVDWLETWKRRYKALRRYFDEHDVYHVALDPDESECITSTLSDDLADVITDLTVGALLFDDSRVDEAVGEWSVRFAHWGNHALMALRTLHWRFDWDGLDG